MTDTTDLSELIERTETQIHEWSRDEPYEDWWRYQKDYATMAALIQSQAAEIERLREALEHIVSLSPSGNTDAMARAVLTELIYNMTKTARQALAPK
jgi:hypothetical protein